MIAAAAVVGAAAASAQAVKPRPVRYLMHDHGTRGDGWHIEMVVARNRGYLRQLVLHSVRCDETVFTTRVRVRNGVIASSKPFPLGLRGTGTWRLEARWIAPNVVVGSFQITKPGCDGGVRAFTAHARHGRHRHVGAGTPVGSYPDLERSPRARRQVNRLWRSSLRAARERFRSYAHAGRAGFSRWARHWRPPMMFHARHTGYERDGRTLDPRRPESLVYWWPRRGSPVLVAFMFRAPSANRPPALGRPLLGWHAHSRRGARGPTQMTHVWLTGDLRSAIANCMPLAELEAANPAFRFVPTHHDLTPESVPCHHAGS